MQSETRVTEASQQYAAAYAAHYQAGDLRGAICSYEEILVTQPGTQEAAYSRTQLLNIVRQVVPVEDLLCAQIDLARARLGEAAARNNGSHSWSAGTTLLQRPAALAAEGATS